MAFWRHMKVLMLCATLSAPTAIDSLAATAVCIMFPIHTLSMTIMADRIVLVECPCELSSILSCFTLKLYYSESLSHSHDHCDLHHLPVGKIFVIWKPTLMMSLFADRWGRQSSRWIRHEGIAWCRYGTSSWDKFEPDHQVLCSHLSQLGWHQ